MIHRILHTADWHYGRTNHSIITSTGEHTKFIDTNTAVNEINKIIKEKSIEVVVFAGDWAQMNKPNPLYNSKVIDTIHSWEDEIQLLIWISGNHTSSPSSNYNAESPLKSAFKKIKHFHFFYDKDINSIQYKDLNFVCVPHTNSLRVKGSKDFEEVILKTESLIDSLKTNILVSHFPLSNAIEGLDDTKFKTDMLDYNLLKNTFKKFDLVLLGDIHRPQKIEKNIFYCGSVIQNTFAEEGEEKGIYVFDVDSTKTIQEDFIKIKSREYKTLKFLKFEDYKKYNPTDFEGSILKIELSISLVEEITKYDKIFQEYFSKSLFVIPDFTLVSNNVKISSLSGLDFKNALDKYIETKYKDDSDKPVLKEEANKILEKVQKEKQYDY